MIESPDETALIGWKAIADYFGIPEDRMRRHRAEMDRAGILFRLVRGTPPHRRTYVASFPSLLQRWIIMRGRI